MMSKKLNYSADNSKKLTPCTTVPTSPNSETGITEFFHSNSKRELVKNYESKIVSLFEILGVITFKLNQKMSIINKKSQKTVKKRLSLYSQQEIKLQAQRSSDKTQLFDYLSSITQDSLNRTESLEQTNKKNLNLIEVMKEKVSEGSVISNVTDKNIDDINRTLVKLYGQKDEKMSILQVIRIEKQKVFETEKLVKNAICSFNKQADAISKRRQLLDRKKNILTENLNELEKNKMRVFKLKFLNERLSKQAQDSFELLEGLRFKRSDLVESLKTRISSIETTAEKVQTQDKLFTLKKNKIVKESERIFKRSSEIFELLKLLELKTQEIDNEFTQVNSREKVIQEKIFQIKDLLHSELSHNTVLNQFKPSNINNSKTLS